MNQHKIDKSREKEHLPIVDSCSEERQDMSVPQKPRKPSLDEQIANAANQTTAGTSTSTSSSAGAVRTLPFPGGKKTDIEH